MPSKPTSLERRLKAARPSAPELPPNFALGVMGAIDRQGLSILPGWRATLGLWARRGAGAVILMLSALLVNGALYDLRGNGGLELLYFGGRFLTALPAALPWDLMLGALAAGLLAAGLLRTGKTARVRMAWVLIVSYVLSAGGGTALAGSGLNQTLHDLVGKGEALPAPMHWFYANRGLYRRPHPDFRFGRVVSMQDGQAMLQNPAGEQLAVSLPPGFKAVVGEHLRMAGVGGKKGFRAGQAQRCQPERVRHYFRHRQMMQGGSMRGGEHGRMMQNGMGGGMKRGQGMGRGRMMGAEPNNSSQETGTPNINGKSVPKNSDQK